MSLIRPEVRDRLWRWREVAVTGFLTLWGVRLIGKGFEQESLTVGGVGAILAVVASILLFYAILRVTFHKPTEAAGVVEIKEREVGYLGPDSGSFVSIDDLTRVEILTTRSDSDKIDAFWILTHMGGEPLLIPASAQGTDQLFDAFAALPGVRLDEAVKALRSVGRDRFLIWQR